MILIREINSNLYPSTGFFYLNHIHFEILVCHILTVPINEIFNILDFPYNRLIFAIIRLLDADNYVRQGIYSVK